MRNFLGGKEEKVILAKEGTRTKWVSRKEHVMSKEWPVAQCDSSVCAGRGPTHRTLCSAIDHRKRSTSEQKDLCSLPGWTPDALGVVLAVPCKALPLPSGQRALS